MIEPAPESGAEERMRTTRSCVPGDRYTRAPLPWNIPEDIPPTARGEQRDNSLPRCGREAHTVYVHDTPEARTFNGRTPTVSQSMQALDTNAQYWSDLSTKAARRSLRVLELQLKLAEEKINNLLHEEAPEQVLLEAAREVHSICFQLDQKSWLCEAGLMPEQQVWFSANTGGNTVGPSRNYGSNPIIEPHIPQSEMGNPPTYGGERNLEKFENCVASLLRFMLMYNLLGPRASKVQLQLLGQCLTDEAQEWFYWQVERFDREVKHWDLESVLMGLQKWFMPTLSLNKVAVSYDHVMQGSMKVQQLHQQLTKLAKQMVELPYVYSYQRRFMNALKPSIRDEVLGKGFTAEFSKIDELVEQAVIVDNAK
ncbi:hypothetical protein M422DRAFT_238961 [Sphaerobolus stellatus SS14]|nr:hypothetical protein M422DRAFT_238961 [Sphaerobolus stellatus SS14]